MHGDTLNRTLGEIVTENIHTARVFERYELDYYCDGGRSLREACESIGTDVDEIAAALAEIEQQSETDFRSMTVDRLIVYIVDTHHAFMKKILPEITQQFQMLEQQHSTLPLNMVTLKQAFTELRTELKEHTASEENEVFPHINKLYDLSKKEGGNGSSQSGALNTQIYLMENEHVNAKDGVAALRSLSENFTAPNNAEAVILELYKQLELLYYDVHIHIHLENNILHPKAIKLEKVFL